MKKTLFTILCLVSMLVACKGNSTVGDDDDDDDDDDMVNPDGGVYTGDKIVFSIAFGEVSYAAVYTKDGRLIETSLENGGEFDLSPGDYYAEIRDEFNRGVYSSDGRLVAVPGVTNAELMLSSTYTIEGVSIPVMIMRVHEDGYSPKYNGVALDRGEMVWEASTAMYGYFRSQFTVYDIERFMEISQFSYISQRSEEWNVVGSRFGQLSCRRMKTNPPGEYPCEVVYGYLDPVNHYSEQDENEDGVCAEGCRGGFSKTFISLVGYSTGVLRYADGKLKHLPIYRNFVEDHYQYASVGTVQAGDVLDNFLNMGMVVRVLADKVVMFGSNFHEGNERIEINTATDAYDYEDFNRYIQYYYNIECVYNGQNCYDPV